MSLTPACFHNCRLHKSNISFIAHVIFCILHSSSPTPPHFLHRPSSSSYTQTSVSYAPTLTHFESRCCSSIIMTQPGSRLQRRRHSAANLAVKVLTWLFTTHRFDSNGNCRSPGLQDRGLNEQWHATNHNIQFAHYWIDSTTIIWGGLLEPFILWLEYSSTLQYSIWTLQATEMST